MQIKSWTVLCTNRCGMQSILLRFHLKGKTHHATREGSKIKQKFAEHNDAFVELMETKVAPERWLPWQRSNKIFLLLFSLANLRDACQIKWQLMHKKKVNRKTRWYHVVTLNSISYIKSVCQKIMKVNMNMQSPDGKKCLQKMQFLEAKNNFNKNNLLFFIKNSDCLVVQDN